MQTVKIVLLACVRGGRNIVSGVYSKESAWNALFVVWNKTLNRRDTDLRWERVMMLYVLSQKIKKCKEKLFSKNRFSLAQEHSKSILWKNLCKSRYFMRIHFVLALWVRGSQPEIESASALSDT